MIRLRRFKPEFVRRAASLIAAGLLLGAAGLDMSPRQDGSRGASGAAANQPPPNVVQLVPAYRQAKRVAVLRVEGVIDRLTLRSLERRIDAARRAGLEAMVIDLHTPGGDAAAARDIVNLLKRDAPVNTIAWINTDAFSAGTLIALAAREIVVHPAARWGDCAPIIAPLGILFQLSPAERAKIEGPLRADMVDSARRFGYDERLVESFVSVHLELWMLENSRTNERIFVDRQEYEALFGRAPSERLSTTSPRDADEAMRERRPLLPLYDQRLAERTRDLDLMTPEEREAEVRRRVEEAQTLPSQRPAIDSLRADDWRPVRQVVAPNQLLTISAAESIEYGLANAVIRNERELMEFFGTETGDRAKDLVYYYESWSEQLVRFLMSGWVRAALVAIFIIGLFLELSAPGVGIFGGVAATALLILMGAPFLAGMAEWWQILAILIGFLLIGIEVFILPGVGVAAIAGILCVLVGIVGSFVSGDLATAQGQEQLLRGIAWTIVAIFTGGVGVWMLSRHVYDFPLFKRLVLSATTDAASSTVDQEGTGMVAPSGDFDLAPGDVGAAETALRPTGRAMFNNRMYDVVSAGGWIDAGTRVRVVEVGRFRIEVEAE